MALQSDFIETATLAGLTLAPARVDKPRSSYESQSLECVRCRCCKGNATLFADVNPGPRPHGPARVLYFRCKMCRQIEIVEVAAQ